MHEVRIITTATRGLATSLHIVITAGAHPYVVCWNFNGASWDHGTYCETIMEASRIYWQKCLEFDLEIQT